VVVVRSFLSDAKKLSISALSQQFARRLMLEAIPRPVKVPW
jgi:hypothetical protein